MDNKDMVDSLFDDIIKDIEYSHKHNIKINQLPHEYELKLALIESIRGVYKEGSLENDIGDYCERVDTYKLKVRG